MEKWTVKNLIKELQCYPENYEVVFDDGGGRYLVVEEVDLDSEDDLVIIR